MGGARSVSVESIGVESSPARWMRQLYLYPAEPEPEPRALE